MNMFFITANIICGICLGLYFKNIAFFIFIIYLLIMFKLTNKKIILFGFLICFMFYFSSLKIQEDYEKIAIDNQEISRRIENY